jgi:hypothetical protein
MRFELGVKLTMYSLNVKENLKKRANGSVLILLGYNFEAED